MLQKLLSFIFVGGAILFLSGCDDLVPEKKSSKKSSSADLTALSDKYQNTKASKTRALTRSTSRRTSSKSSSHSSSVSFDGGLDETISAVGDYGTGLTSLKIKKRQEEKIKAIESRSGR